MRFLFVTTVGSTMHFFVDLVKQLICEGHIVDIAANETIKALPAQYAELDCTFYHISCERSPLNRGNAAAIREIEKLLKDNHYDIVHCHTPIAGAITRLACRKFRKDGLKVIYTAHGFHFYKGAPLKNWLIYYPIEKFCSRFTDVLITINQEDYERAKKKMKAKRIEYVPGVGIDVDKFANTVVERAEKRKELGIPENAFLILSVGELNTNKNHAEVILSIAERNEKNIHYMIAGEGPLKSYLKHLAEEHDMGERLHLLGYRTDVNELYKISDLYVLPSLREGLNVSLMEARASNLRCECKKIRGNTDILNAEDMHIFDTGHINKIMLQIYGVKG